MPTLRTLMTGANGQVGRELRKRLPDALTTDCSEVDGLPLTRLIDLTWSQLNIIHQFLTIRPEPEVVLAHLAAHTGVVAAQGQQREQAMAVNFGGTTAVATVSDHLRAKLFAFSTEMVSGSDQRFHHETELPGPFNSLSVYGQSKFLAEQAVRTIIRQPPFPTIVRVAWVIGEGRNFVRAILWKRARGEKEIPVINDRVGRPTFAKDLAEALAKMIALHEGGHNIPPIVHCQNEGDPISWADLAEKIVAIADEIEGIDGRSTTIIRVPAKRYYNGAGQPFVPAPPSSVLGMSKLNSLGIHMPPWEESLPEYIPWARVRYPDLCLVKPEPADTDETDTDETDPDEPSA